MQTYLVTGGAGFIGSHLIERLIGQGHRVRVLDNLSTGALKNLARWNDQIEFIEADVQHPDATRRAVEGVDVVFHQAALASVPRSVANPLATHDACVTGTVVLLDACRRAGVRRLVYAASSSAYGNSATLPKRESQYPSPLSPYAAAKLAGEFYCAAFAATYGLETVGLRYFNVFGPRQDPHSPYAAVIPLFVSALLEGRQPTIFGDGTQSRDFTYVANVVEANLCAATAPAASGKVYNVGCGGNLRVIDLLQEICQILDKPCDPIFTAPRTGDVLHSLADITAAERDLAYKPLVDWKSGLPMTVEYYVQYYTKRSNGMAAAAR